MSLLRSDVERRETARLVLRRITESDIAALVAIDVDPANFTHSPDGAYTPELATAHVRAYMSAWARNGIGYWVVEHDGAVIGVAGLAPMTFAGGPCFNLYYRFVTGARGRGLAAETCREALAVAASLDPSSPVVVRTRPANGPARRLAEALGLRRRRELDTEDGFVVYASDPS